MMTIVILWHQRVKLVRRVPYMIVIETALLRVPLLENEVVDFSKFFWLQAYESEVQSREIEVTT